MQHPECRFRTKKQELSQSGQKMQAMSRMSIAVQKNLQEFVGLH
jgi:hypothetical protein